MTASQVKTAFTALTISLFFIFTLASPLAFLANERDKWSPAENRSLAVPPPLPVHYEDLPGFFIGIENYLNDHFGLRTFYLSRYHRELDKRFGIASKRSVVIKGLEGWYFFNEFDLIKDFLGQISLDQQQLEAWLAWQEMKNDWLRNQGIHFLYLIAPNKQSIYPEFLMQNALSLKGTSRFEQLLHFTDGRLPDYMVNLHELFEDKADEKILYYKTDSHWNNLGAYTAFKKVFSRITQWYPHENFTTEFAFTADQTGPGGDLAGMLMLPELTETSPDFASFKPSSKYKSISSHLSGISSKNGQVSYIKECSTKNLTAVIFRDSFFNQLEPLFSENFKKVIYLWKDYDQKNIEEILSEFKPDIVIEEVVERHMFDPLLNKNKNVLASYKNSL